MLNLLRTWRTAGSPEVTGAERLRPNRDVLSTQHEGVTILLDLRREVYLDTADVGSDVWRALERGATRDEIVAELAEEYDAPADVLRADVDRFMKDLIRRRLVVRA